MTSRIQVIPPDQLAGDALTSRVKGDALHLVELVNDHGANTLNQVLDHWGPDHVRRVIIALAAAVDPDATASQLWDWLGEPNTRTSRTLTEQRLWRIVDREELGANPLKVAG